MKNLIIKREEGQGMVEYALMLALVAVVVIVILALLGDAVIVTYARVMGGFNGQTVTMTGNEAILVGLDVQQSDNGDGTCDYTVSAVAIVGLTDGQLRKDETVAATVNAGGNPVANFSANVGSSGVGSLTGSQSGQVACGAGITVVGN